MKAKCRNCGHQSELERCPKCNRLMPQRWFIVVGANTEQQAISERILAHTPAAAQSIFKEFHRGASIYRTWDCGQDKPEEV